jgi:hypothetical protein
MEASVMPIPVRVLDRMKGGLKRLLPILTQQKTRDVSEADTVTLIKDVLAEVFGYDKYAELTGEHAIRGSYCDLAVKLEEKVVQLIEVKAIGIALDDRHVKQIVDYAANEGVEWVILTNALTWRLYQVIFAKPIDKRLLLEINLLSLDLKSEDTFEKLYLFSKEGFVKGAQIELRDRQDASSRYMISALLLNNDTVISTIRRELRRVVDVGVEEEVILAVLRDEVIKRETLEGPNADQAARRVSKHANHAIYTSSKSSPSATPTSESPCPPKNENVINPQA